MSKDQNHLGELFNSLKQSGYTGDIETSYGARIVAATDNSIYQVLPEAILYPARGQDINSNGMIPVTIRFAWLNSQR